MQTYVPLKENKDFLRLYYRGKSSAKPSVVVYGSKNRVGTIRVGITTSKKIGNAVERNRSRRVIRAAFRQVLKDYEINGNRDIVFVARTRTKFLKSTKVYADMLEALRQIGAVK